MVIFASLWLCETPGNLDSVRVLMRNLPGTPLLLLTLLFGGCAAFTTSRPKTAVRIVLPATWLEAEIASRFDRAAHGFGPLAMTRRPRQAPARGPTPVAIHDDGNMGGNAALAFCSHFHTVRSA